MKKLVLVALVLLVCGLPGCSTLQVQPGCPQPPPVRDGMSLLYCGENKELGVTTCGYIGLVEGELCLMVASAPTCSNDWSVNNRTCGFKLLTPQAAQEMEQPQTQSIGY